ncbi:acyltransferase family protein [Gordonia pseudamarae]|uniref:Acyltransferase family protein n=1 Tax=Gordonia pseudamarae TaxID=2831662 RepID=A0ABX6ING1_9ACTN|nr:acyltransferase family protein [Gordonia pseudamarae]QHN36831.1 acyltransferase family protein [Gordonia pseudamarae]
MPARRFFPQLEGMRAVAAIAVLTTHVSFQTGAVNTAVIGPILGRLDLAVALFFGLSGFLLWRPWAQAARTGVQSPGEPGRPPSRGARSIPRPDIGRYFRHRIVRIWPAYVVVVVLVLTLLPDAKGADLTVWLANLTLTQVFVALSLTAGLTQMWSLSVEVAFYLLLPLIGLALVRLRGDLARLRVPVILAVGVLSLGWAWFAATLPLADGVEPKNWVFGHLPWFVAGLVLAEIAATTDVAGHHPRWLRITVAPSANRPLMAAVFVVAYALACTPLAGPTGLGELTHLQFATKMVLGAIVGYALLAPLVCAPGPFRFLDSPVMQALGRWSYGIFIWHLAVLAVVFPLFGIVPFNGDMPLVLALTVALTIGVSAASYTFIEDPARRWINAREANRTVPNA